VLVAAGILLLRRTILADHALPHTLVLLVPLLAIVTCGYLMVVQPKVTWWRFVIWLAVGWSCTSYMDSAAAAWHRRSRASQGPRHITKPWHDRQTFFMCDKLCHLSDKVCHAIQGRR